MKVNDSYYIRPRNETCENYYFCVRSDFDANNSAYYSALGTIFFGLLFSFVFCYVSIICFIQKHDYIQNRPSSRRVEISVSTTITGEPDNRTLGADNSAKPIDVNVSSRYRRTLNLIMWLIILYLTCRIPIWVFNIVDNSRRWNNSVFKASLKYSLTLLSNLNCAVNPFVYTIWNDALRSQSNFARNDSNGRPKRRFCCNKLGGLCSRTSEHSVSKDHLSVVGIFGRRNINKYDVNRLSKAVSSSHSTQKYCISEKIEWPLSTGIKGLPK